MKICFELSSAAGNKLQQTLTFLDEEKSSATYFND